MKLRVPTLCNDTFASSLRFPSSSLLLHHTLYNSSDLAKEDTADCCEREVCDILRHCQLSLLLHSCYDVRQLTNISTLTKLDIYLADADVDQPNPRR